MVTQRLGVAASDDDGLQRRRDALVIGLRCVVPPSGTRHVCERSY
jgi:hypothetical protein